LFFGKLTLGAKLLNVEYHAEIAINLSAGEIGFG